MLNRKNRMQSANLNGLNLGSRMLANGGGLNIVCSTLRARLGSKRVDHPGHIMQILPPYRVTWDLEPVTRPDSAWSKTWESGMTWPLTTKAQPMRLAERPRSAADRDAVAFSNPRPASAAARWRATAAFPRAHRAAGRTGAFRRDGIA